MQRNKPDPAAAHPRLMALAEAIWVTGEHADDHPWVDVTNAEFGETIGVAAAILVTLADAGWTLEEKR
jgi:hypothetical protein